MIILDPIEVSAPGVFVSSNVPEDDAPAHTLTRAYAAGDQVLATATHEIFESKVGVRAPVTLAIGSPGVINWAAHGQVANTPVSFVSTGTLLAPLLANVIYYVVSPTPNAFSVSTSAGGAAVALTGSQSGVHNATASQNANRPLTDSSYWLQAGATNRWKMFDAYNNTQTEHADSIVFTVCPQAIAQGIYLGNIDVDEISITGTDPTDGVVFSETTSMVIEDSNSSFFNWLFKPIRRRRQFCTLSLPLYYAASFEVRLKKPGGLAKCGMFRIGPLVDVGLSEYGLEAEIKDYSSTKFNFDGTSKTELRGYSKRQSVDVEVSNEIVSELYERMIEFRQRTVVFIGAKHIDLTLVCGVYSGFKIVIPGFRKSKLSLQIEGKV